MAVDQIHMTGFDFFQDEDTREAAGFITRELQSDRNRRMSHWLATATQWPDGLAARLERSRGAARPVPKQTRDLADELAAVVDRVPEAAAGPGRAARRDPVRGLPRRHRQIP